MKNFFAQSKKDVPEASDDTAALMEIVDAQIGRAVTRLGER